MTLLLWDLRCEARALGRVGFRETLVRRSARGVAAVGCEPFTPDDPTTIPATVRWSRSIAGSRKSLESLALGLRAYARHRQGAALYDWGRAVVPSHDDLACGIEFEFVACHFPFSRRVRRDRCHRHPHPHPLNVVSPAELHDDLVQLFELRKDRITGVASRFADSWLIVDNSMCPRPRLAAQRSVGRAVRVFRADKWGALRARYER